MKKRKAKKKPTAAKKPSPTKKPKPTKKQPLPKSHSAPVRKRSKGVDTPRAKPGTKSASRPQSNRPVISAVERDGSWCLVSGTAQIETWKGTPIRHRSRELITDMAAQLNECKSVSVAGASLEFDGPLGYFLAFVIHHQWALDGMDDVSQDFADCLARDPILRTCAGPECAWQLPCYGPVWSAFKDEISALNELASTLDQGQFDESFDRTATIGEAMPAIRAVESVHNRLAPEHKTLVMMLHARHGNQVLAPIALARGACKLSDYEDAVVANQGMLSEAFRDVRRKDEREFRATVNAEARTMLEYARLSMGGSGDSGAGEGS